jgi:hypothetical protein
MKIVALFLILFITGFNVQAESTSYVLQVGAYKQLDMTRFSVLEQHGTLYTEESAGQGFTRVTLGNFDSRAEAQDALINVHKLGFQDAFLRSAGSSVAATFEADDAPIVEMPSSYNSDGYLNPQSLPIWNQLSNDQRKNVVYLDGILHIEEDGQFIRLSDYARRR